jgi:predicted nuclease of restriction endonuclease-like (RecB) superfamily
MTVDLSFREAAIAIKDAIVRSRFQAATLVNKELLSLYYGVGKYVSDNSRVGYWGQGAIKQISENLQRELPGLRGFSEGAIKKMRLFYEEWSVVFVNRSLATNDLSESIDDANRSLPMNDLEMPPSITDAIDLELLSRQMDGFNSPYFIADEFLRVGFTHQYTIISQEKSLDGRLFYISRCAAEFWSVETLKSHLRGELYQKTGTMPNNFLQTLPPSEQAHRAMRAFKEEYFLDFINIEDEVDPDERVVERSIVSNIKQFILSFGNKFCFIGNQYRVVAFDKEFYIDLLFFHRELRCLVAVELKRGEFSPAHLGQLNFYLSALDEYIKQDDEAPSIGILLCKEADRSFVEFAVRDYTKPMGVATYRTRSDMPESLQKALPDHDDIKRLLDNLSDEQTNEVDE